MLISYEIKHKICYNVMNEIVNTPLKYNVGRASYVAGVLRRFGWKSNYEYIKSNIAINKSNNCSYDATGNRVLASIS